MTSAVYATLPSPIGELLLVGDGTVVHGLHMQAGPRLIQVPSGWRRSPDAFADARRQLHEYFAGERTAFALALDPGGTPFARRSWRALETIPYGTTRSYGRHAALIGHPGAARAVGLANGRNPILIIIPCHRLVAHDGALTGFGGGLERKRLLLDHEARHVCNP